MYCPKCSQQQVSEEVRFCARCGFQLDALKTLLAEDQNISMADENKRRSQLTPRRKRDILLGATLMLVASVLIALLMISTVAGTPVQAVIIPLLLMWAAIVSALLLSGHAAREVTRLFSKDASLAPERTSSGLITQVSDAARQKALPPVQAAPGLRPGSWRSNTAELTLPPSITEHTTNLLDKK